MGAGAIGIGSSLIGGLLGQNAADDQADAAREGLAFNRDVYRDAQGNFSPYLGIGQTGVNALGALAGGDYSGFMNSPDYLASQKAAQYGFEHSAAKQGRLFSGGALADLAQLNQDHASGFLNNYRNSLMGYAGLGLQGAQGIAGAGSNAAGNAMQGYNQLGNAQASGWGSLAGGLFGAANAFGQGYGSTTSAYGTPQAPPVGARWGGT